MPKKPTDARGLGWEHAKRRKEMRPANGEPCPYCSKPMWPQQRLDADHVIPRSLGGSHGPLRWAHASCNRRAGAVLGNKQRNSATPSRRW